MIIIWFLGIIVLIVVITVLINIFKNWTTLMNYKNLFSFFIIGFIPLSITLYFTSKDILTNAIAYTILVIFSLFYGAFKKNKN